jgi:hypothetical protein
LSLLPNRRYCSAGTESIRLIELYGFEGSTMLQKFLLREKTAECERAIKAARDPQRREMLTHLRTLWVNLARESQHMDSATLAEQTAAIARIHAAAHDQLSRPRSSNMLEHRQPFRVLPWGPAWSEVGWIGTA